MDWYQTALNASAEEIIVRGKLRLRSRFQKTLLPPKVERNDLLSKSWRINLEKFHPLPEKRDAEHGCSTLQRIPDTLIWKRYGVDDYYKKQKRQLEGHTEIETMIETGCAPGNPAEPLLPLEVEKNDMSFKSCSKLKRLLSLEVEINDMSSESRSRLEPLLPPEVEGNDMSTEWRINLEEFPVLPKRRDAERGSFTLCFLRTPIWKRREVDDYYKKQEKHLKGYHEVKTMMERGCVPGNPAEDEIKLRERMAILVTNIADIVLFALKVFASIESKSLSVIASTLDPFFDLLWGFILWLTSHAMQNPNPHKYPIGKKRMQPVGMIVFGSFGLQLLFQAAKQFITKSEPEKDPKKEKWMIGVMTFVTMVQFMLAFYCRRFENKIVRAYAEHHSSNVKTNLISVAAAVLAIRYYWWIDPTGAIIILLYTMNSWKKTFFENLSALIGRTAPPEFLAKLTYLILNHHEDIKHIDTVKAYAHGSDHYIVEVDIVLPQDMVLRETHDIGETLQVKLEQLPEVERAFVHVDYEYSHKPEHRTTV